MGKLQCFGLTFESEIPFSQWDLRVWQWDLEDWPKTLSLTVKQWELRDLCSASYVLCLCYFFFLLGMRFTLEKKKKKKHDCLFPVSNLWLVDLESEVILTWPREHFTSNSRAKSYGYKHTYIRTEISPPNSLVWGSLRLAPITALSFQICKSLMMTTVYWSKRLILSNNLTGEKHTNKKKWQDPVTQNYTRQYYVVQWDLIRVVAQTFCAYTRTPNLRSINLSDSESIR